jgi:hypothetical protein
VCCEDELVMICAPGHALAGCVARNCSTGVGFGLSGLVATGDALDVVALLAHRAGREARPGAGAGSGRSANESQFGLGDLYVQPVWLDWALEHFDFAFGYGFYAPTGKYSTETILLPVIDTSVTVEAADNIGLGFWTHQLQGAASWYPWVDRRMAVTTALTYEINGNKKDFDLKPGQNLSWNWGVSQFLPLKKDQTLLLEAGVAGYSTWQISDDSGADALNPPTKDQVHGVGGQAGLTVIPWNASFNFHYFYEFASNDRFKGQSIGLNIAVKL